MMTQTVPKVGQPTRRNLLQLFGGAVVIATGAMPGLERLLPRPTRSIAWWRFLMVSSIDHVSGLTGADIVAAISINGGRYEPLRARIEELGDGFYQVALSELETAATEVKDVGLHFTAPGADPTDMCMMSCRAVS